MGSDNLPTREEFDALVKRVNNIESQQHSSNTALALFKQSMDSIKESLAEIKATLKVIQDKPAKRWDAIMGYILQWAVTGLLAYVALGK